MFHIPPRNPLICGQGAVPYLWSGPWARGAGPRARSIGMEQHLGRKSKGFWGAWNKIPAGALGGEVFGQTHIILSDLAHRGT